MAPRIKEQVYMAEARAKYNQVSSFRNFNDFMWKDLMIQHEITLQVKLAQICSK